MKKLHLGCGTKHLENYTNIDIRYLPGVDEVNNIRFLRNYKENSVDEIYACHVLEHFGRWEYKEVLKRWFEILKPGGKLRLAVPDFGSIVAHYRTPEGKLNDVIGLLYGGQDYDENYHYITFDYSSLETDLKQIGFKELNLWDPEKYSGDDFSKAYLPHMDKENGILMSLNIIAIK
jgi:predicted SAM-dependent methyltransferase